MEITFDVFEIEPNDASYNSLGDMTIETDEIHWTSKNRIPDQGFMLFPTLQMLFDVLEKIEMGDAKKGTMHSIGSSIELDFIFKKEILEVRERKILIAKTSIDDFAIALWEAYQGTLDSIGMDSVEELGDGSEDLFLSALNFRVAFAHAFKEGLQ
jgi:hypothetical protein